MMALYCRRSAAIERDFAELGAVSDVDEAAKTLKFLNENLWKDEKRLRKLCNMEADAGTEANEMEHFVEKL
nr:hypothetical protein [Tanacetum cinerariifolium]